MTQDPRYSTPQKGYFEGMPGYMKMLSALTVVCLAIGWGMMIYGQVAGTVLVVIIVAIIVLRVWEQMTLMLGPQTVIGYTLEYGFESLDRRFKYFGWVVGCAFVAFIIYGGVMTIMEQ